MIEWFSSLEPGPASAWVAIAVASVFGVISAVGVGVTLSAYRDGIRERRVATARVVWAEPLENAVVASSGELLELRRHEEIDRREFVPHMIKPSNAIREEVSSDGSREVVGSAPVASFYVAVHNQSDEPISDVSVISATEAIHGTEHPHSVAWLSRSIRPKSTKHIRVTVQLQNVHLVTPAVELFFTDSAGVEWYRSDFDPPRRVKGRSFFSHPQRTYFALTHSIGSAAKSVLGPNWTGRSRTSPRSPSRGTSRFR